MLRQYGPWALITGGSEGVGAAFAHQLAAAGINLILVARNQALLHELARSITAESGVDVRTLALDLSEPDAIDRIRAAAAGVEVGLLVCNVGKQYGSGGFLEGTADDIARTFRVNSMSHALLSHHFGQGMVARGRGGIILIGSLACAAGGATMVMYSAGKAFAQNFAEGLWAELQPKGVDVLYVVLGATDTPVRARLGLTDPPGLYLAPPEEVAREALASLPNGPVLVPAHLAEGFAFFSSAPRREAAEAMRALLTGFGTDALAES